MLSNLPGKPDSSHQVTRMPAFVLNLQQTVPQCGAGFCLFCILSSRFPAWSIRNYIFFSFFSEFVNIVLIFSALERFFIP